MPSLVSLEKQYYPCGPDPDNQPWSGFIEVSVSFHTLASPTAGGQVFREFANQLLAALLFDNTPVGIYAVPIARIVSALNKGFTVRLCLTGVKRKTGQGVRGEGVLNGKVPNAAGRLFENLQFVLLNTVTGQYDLAVIFKRLPTRSFLTYQDYVASLYETKKVTLKTGGVSLGHYLQAYEPLVRFLLLNLRRVEITGVAHSSIMGGKERAPNTLFTMWLYYDLPLKNKLFFSYNRSTNTVSVSLTGDKPPEKAVFKGYKEGEMVELTKDPLNTERVFEYVTETYARFLFGTGLAYGRRGKPSTGHFALLAKMFPEQVTLVETKWGYIISFPKEEE
jgi:hypothetical protein